MARISAIATVLILLATGVVAYIAISKTSQPDPRTITLDKAKEFLAGDGFTDWEQTDRGTVRDTTARRGRTVYTVSTEDDRLTGLMLFAFRNPGLPDADVRRLADILVRRATGCPLPDDLADAIKKRYDDSVTVGVWRVAVYSTHSQVSVHINPVK